MALKETARCFVGMRVPGSARAEIERVLRRLRGLTGAVRWVAPARLHVTLAFLGDVPRARLDEIRTALRSVEAPLPMELGVRGLGAFPDTSRPRVLWAGIYGDSDRLALLAAGVGASMERLGLVGEDRPFRAHVTLGRVKHARAGAVLRPELVRSDLQSTLGTVRSFSLFESRPTPDGSIYEEIERFGVEA